MHFSDSLIYHVLVVTDSVIISVIIKTTHLLSHNSHSMELVVQICTTICTILSSISLEMAGRGDLESKNLYTRLIT